MFVRCLEVVELAVCCYIVAADGDGETDALRPCVVVDPGDEADRISRVVRKSGLEVEMILLTHAHADHIGGVGDMLRLWPNAVLACSAETSRRAVDPRLNLSVFLGAPIVAPAAGRLLGDGETFTAGGLSWRAVEIPGHDPGEMAFVPEKGGAAFVGDVIFAGSVGRSDFPGGDGALLVAGARAFLQSLDLAAVIYPGHGPSTTAERELRTNPFLI